MSDDHTLDATRRYAGRINNEPDLARIAAGGVRFGNDFCADSICTSSRTTILAGTHKADNSV